MRKNSDDNDDDTSDIYINLQMDMDTCIRTRVFFLKNIFHYVKIIIDRNTKTCMNMLFSVFVVPVTASSLQGPQHKVRKGRRQARWVTWRKGQALRIGFRGPLSARKHLDALRWRAITFCDTGGTRTAS